MQGIGFVIIAILSLAIIVAICDFAVKYRKEQLMLSLMRQSRAAAKNLEQQKRPLSDAEYKHRVGLTLEELGEDDSLANRREYLRKKYPDMYQS